MNAIQLYFKIMRYPYDLSGIRPLDGENAEEVLTAFLDSYEAVLQQNPKQIWSPATYIYGENDTIIFDTPHMIYMWDEYKAALFLTPVLSTEDKIDDFKITI